MHIHANLRSKQGFTSSYGWQGRPTRLAASALAGLLACGGADDTPPSGPGLDPDVDPVTDGDWYGPEVTTTWQWQLVGTVAASYDVDVYDIDLFDNDASVVDALHADGRKVICYFSAGSSEDWRPDFDRFSPEDMGRKLDDWEGERWLDITSDTVLAIMLGRLDMAAAKGCDGVEPDNVDAYDNDTGFALTAEHQLGYNRRLANEAHERGLTVLLKNDGGQASELVDYYDGSLNEQCHQYDECGDLAPFIDGGAPIFNAEYANDEGAAEDLAADVCPRAEQATTRTLILPWDLDDSFRVSCDG